MIRTSGRVIRHTARLLHIIMVATMGLLLAVSLLLAGIAFRLSMGPINASWLSAAHAEPFVINGTVGLSSEGIALAWEGFQGGVGSPIDFRLSNITVVDPEGHRLLRARRAFLSLSLAALLRGQLVPRRVELDDGTATVTRARDGSFNLGLATGTTPGATSERADQPATLKSVVRDLIHPVDSMTGRGPAERFRRIRLRNFGLVVHDEQLGLTWQAAGSELDIEQHPSGAIVGSAHVPFTLGDQHAQATLRVDLPHGTSGRIEATIGTIQPAMIATLASAVPVLAAVQVPLSMRAIMDIDDDLMPSTGRAEIKVGAGNINLGAGDVPVRDGLATLAGTPEQLEIKDARLNVSLPRTGTLTGISLTGLVQRHAKRLTGTVKVGLDNVDVADLGELWPDRLAGGGRPWIVQNVTVGTVHHASAELVAESGADLHDIVLTKASADLDADNVSITWLDQVPPIERAQLHLHLADPDKLAIAVLSGHQRISKGGTDLLLRDGQVEISGLSRRDQDASIRLPVEGSVASTIALLKEPRLHLLSRQSVDLKDASGAASIIMSLQFPLVASLDADQIQFKSSAHLSNVRVGKIVAGRDLRDGDFNLAVDNDGLGFKGPAVLASIPVTLNGAMDFTLGPSSQVLQRVTASGRPDVDQLAAAGFNLKAVALSGNVPLTVTLLERRSGDGSVALNADLTAMMLTLQPLAWVKPAGVASEMTAMLLLSHDRLTAIPRVAVEGNTFSLTGSASCADGAVRAVTIDRATFGKTDLRGTITLPANGAIDVALSGQQLDLSAKLGETQSPSSSVTSTGVTNDVSAKAPDWKLGARFDHALLANGEHADPLSVRVRSDNGTLRLLDLTGSLSPGAGFSARINAASGGRRLTVASADAGALLKATGLTTAVREGRLTIDGVYDDKQAGHPLVGTAWIENTRIIGVPALGKLLQAMTLYGLTDLLRGPGIGASQIVVPFQFADKHLQINDARLFSASLGLTAKGTVDLAANQVAISGTIVPAYVFNSVLGYIPFVGKLFSPEVGGGLFAARYRVDGPFSDISTSVNPLSVLTPGVLRGLFDIMSDAH